MTQLYKPNIAVDSIEEYSNLIIGIQGPPASGKTAASLTFPNPIVALFERPDLAGLKQLDILKDVNPILLPFYDIKWMEEKKLPGRLFNPPNENRTINDSAGAFLQWLGGKDAREITNQQTLILDNWTRLQEQFDEVNWSYKSLSKDGKVDDWAPWDRKITFAEEISNNLISLSCNVVVLFHEIQERDKATGLLLDKLQPLQQGKFIAKLKSYYPNFFRQHCRSIKDANGKDTTEIEYMWQVKSGSGFDAKCSKPKLPTFIPAQYKSLLISS